MSALPAWQRLKNHPSHEILKVLGVQRVPIPVEDIATALGIHVWYVPEPGWEGACETSEKRADLWVRAESPWHRQRLTIAHEIGHIILHPVGVQFRDAAPGMYDDPPSERQANLFAFALLMPRVKLEPIMYETNYSFAQMARMFDVSVQALDRRAGHILRTGFHDDES